ncbi:phosphoglycerate kinase [Streptococcus pneumoniae]|uniref:phosphoglycerate kinase n=1 Tax=Streptococcus pneumoniae TaxID=1313 RepID=UPI0005D7BCF8|nr:phosphoglycerate kinase [Streptococcus pneumoniae]COS95578.1 phosphoglycerate kinase [Streptococcus pneumoniae]
MKQFSEGFLGLDIGPKSIAKLDEALTGAKTVVWNGPMGVFETQISKLVQSVCVMDAIVKQPGVKSIIGGGDSAAAAINLAVQTSSHGLVRVVEHQWNFLKVRFFQDLQP